MNIADNPKSDYRALVKNGYDRCAADYAGQRRTVAEQELDLLTTRLHPGSEILDIGCGAGIPITRHLTETFNVTGIDLSPRMIDLARKNVPKGTFIVGDILEAKFSPNSFDGIVSFYAIFHIPRQEHQALLRLFTRWLRPGGLLLFTVARKDDGPGYTEDDFFGGPMYWSNFGPSMYSAFLNENGFTIEQEGVVGHGYENSEALEEVHPFFFAVRE